MFDTLLEAAQLSDLYSSYRTITQNDSILTPVLHKVRSVFYSQSSLTAVFGSLVLHLMGDEDPVL